MNAVLQSLFRLFFGARMQPFEGIPGPTPLFPLGNLSDFNRERPWESCASYAKTHGRLVQVWLPWFPVLILNDPELIERVLITEQASFYKDRMYRAARPMLTDRSTFIAKVPDEKWRDLRRNNPLSMPYFQEWLAAEVPELMLQIHGKLEALVRRSQTNSIPIYNAIHRLAFDSFALATLGEELGDILYQSFLTMSDVADKRLKSRFPYPESPEEDSYIQASTQWFARFDEISNRALQDSSGNDLLSWVIRKGQTHFSGQALRDAFAEIDFVGAFSTPSAITSTLYLLDRNPYYRSRLIEAIEELPLTSLKLEDIEKCLPLEQNLWESLRIYPPVPFFTRNTLEDRTITFDRYEIPPNTPIFMSNWYLHRQESYWQDPLTFNPERWDEKTRAANPLGSGHFFPFGRGDRACLGMAFATFYIKIALITILSKVRVEFDADSSEELTFHLGAALPRKLRGRFIWHARSTASS